MATLNNQQRYKRDKKQNEGASTTNSEVLYGNINLEEAYFEDIKDLKQLSRQEEQILMREIQEAREKFYSCLLSHTRGIKFILDFYEDNKCSFLRLYKYFKVASGHGRKSSLEEAKSLFIKNMRVIKSLIEENKADYDLVKRLSNGDKQQRKRILSRINRRVKKANILIKELGFRNRKLFEKKYSVFETLYKTIHQYSDSELRERDFKSDPLVRHFLEYSSDIYELKDFLDKLIPLHDKYIELRNRMMEANLKLVISIAKKMTNDYLQIPDAIQAGNLGLMKAIDGYSLNLEHKFSTYATYWIRQTIGRTRLSQRGTAYLNQRVLKVLRERDKLILKLGRDPTSEEIAKSLGFKTSVIEDALRLHRMRFISIDAPIFNDRHGDDAAFPEIEDKSKSIENEKKALAICRIVRDAINELAEEEQVRDISNIKRNCAMLLMRFGIEFQNSEDVLQKKLEEVLLNQRLSDNEDERGTTLREVASAFHVTRERVRQITEHLFKKLKPILLRKSELADYLPYVEENMDELMEPEN